jgi:hypothetical protein
MKLIKSVIKGGGRQVHLRVVHLRKKKGGTTTRTGALVGFALGFSGGTTRLGAWQSATTTEFCTIKGRRERVEARTGREVTKNMLIVKETKVIECIRVSINTARKVGSIKNAEDSKICRIKSHIVSRFLEGRNHMNSMSSKRIHTGAVMHGFEIKEADGGAGVGGGKHGRAGGIVTGKCSAIICK